MNPVKSNEAQFDSTELSRFFKAFVFALDGFSYVLVHERNMKIHMVAAFLVFLFEFITRPDLLAVTLSTLAVAVVMAAELLNTVVERVVDAVTGGEFVYFAKVAKDAAAGAVLMTSWGSLGVGLYIVVTAYPWHWLAFSNHHLVGAAVSASGLVGLGILSLRSYWWSQRNP